MSAAAMYVEHIWHGIEAGMREKGVKPTDIRNMQLTFVGGIQTAINAVMLHKARVEDLHTATDWLTPEPTKEGDRT